MENSKSQQPSTREVEQQSFFEKLTNSIAVKLVTMLILLLFLLIPMEWVNGLIAERHDRERGVEREIASKWGESQVLSGPIIGVPYTVMRQVSAVDENGRNKTEAYLDKDYIFLAAKNTSFVSKVSPTYLKRGIYRTVVYQATAQIQGHFDEIDFSKLEIENVELHWEKAKMFIGLSDLKGLTTTPKLIWEGQQLSFGMGNSNVHLFERTLEADIDLSERSTKGRFSIQMDIRGARGLSVLPSAEETSVKISGTWSSPSFGGGFLPEERQTGGDSFQAVWRIPGYGRKFPQQWTGFKTQLYVIDPLAAYGDAPSSAPTAPAIAGDEGSRGFGTSTAQDMVEVYFIPSVDNYQKTTRVAKYGILVVALTFASLFFTEIIKRYRIHLVQYILIGCAMVLFYSLLLAIGEHLGFNWAYLISAVATTLLIASFIWGITKQPRISYLFSSILTIFYAFVYVLMQLQDFSLVVGAVGMFIILAVLMRLSLRIHWFQFEKND